jgi:hypothetical protein
MTYLARNTVNKKKVQPEHSEHILLYGSHPSMLKAKTVILLIIQCLKPILEALKVITIRFCRRRCCTFVTHFLLLHILLLL